jgi:hypothetical protein
METNPNNESVAQKKHRFKTPFSDARWAGSLVLFCKLRKAVGGLLLIFPAFYANYAPTDRGYKVARSICCISKGVEVIG